jgi:predicted phosphodiesterase
MLPDFEIITHEFPSRPDLTIYPISDVHFGAAEHKEREWEQFCIDILKDENAYITLGGDLINNATKTSVSNVYDEKYRPREQKRIITEMLRPIKDRILCAVSGNHERRSSKEIDDDPTYDIMAKLDLEHLYRENIAFVRIRMGNSINAGDRNPTYILTVTHGSGGGILTGGAVNRGERFGYVLDGCDALIVGHTHKPFVTQPAKIKIDATHNMVSIKPFKVISSTSWMEYGGYAAQKMLTPSSHAPQVITLYGKRKEIKVAM